SDSVIGSRRHEVQRIVRDGICDATNRHRRDRKVDDSSARVTGGEGATSRRGEPVYSSRRGCVWGGGGEGDRKRDGGIATHECLEIAETRTRRSVQAGRTQTSERDHDRVAHASEEGHRVSATARAAAAGKNT